jgi:hypothetical protein
MSPRRAAVRFYVDADVLGLAHILVQLHPDVTYPGDPGGTLNGRFRDPCPVATTEVPDAEWIPLVAAQGWVIITRDARIQERPAEIAAVRDAGAKMVNHTADAASSKWGALQVVARHWNAITQLHLEAGPFIYKATLTSIERIDLGRARGR